MSANLVLIGILASSIAATILMVRSVVTVLSTWNPLWVCAVVFVLTGLTLILLRAAASHSR